MAMRGSLEAVWAAGKLRLHKRRHERRAPLERRMDPQRRAGPNLQPTVCSIAFASVCGLLRPAGRLARDCPLCTSGVMLSVSVDRVGVHYNHLRTPVLLRTRCIGEMRATLAATDTDRKGVRLLGLFSSRKLMQAKPDDLHHSLGSSGAPSTCGIGSAKFASSAMN